MSLLSSLYIGLSGLNASSNALNTTAHNLANVDTDGYVRQQVMFGDSKYQWVGQRQDCVMQTGMGVDIQAVKQVRNTFLDRSYRQEAGRQAFYDTQSEAVSEVEALFGELQGAKFQDNMSDLWTSIQELAKTPYGTARSTFVQSAAAFVERAGNIYEQLSDYQMDLNTKILNQVKKINEIGDKINSINQQVRVDESSGLERANDLRDQRNLLLDQLGKIASIDIHECIDGTVTVDLEGASFVSQEHVYHMDTAKVSDSSDMLKPVWPTYGGVDVYNLDNAATSSDNTDIGSLKGLLVTRGGRQANYTDIPLRKDYIDLAHSTPSVTKYNEAAYQAAVRKYNNEVESSAIMTAQAQFDQLVHGIVTTINDILSPNKEVTLQDGTKVKILDEENAPVGKDANHTAGEGLFNRKLTSRYQEPKNITVKVFNADGTPVLDPNGVQVVQTITNARIYNEEDKSDKHSLFSLGELEINQKIRQEPSFLPLSSSKGQDDYDAAITLKLKTAWNQDFATLSPNTLTTNNFDGYYITFTSAMANRGDKLGTISKNQASMVQGIDNKRSEVMGVSSDDELTNLIKFQHAYNAASRYINVIDQLLEQMVNNL